jgi:hypothetical protein
MSINASIKYHLSERGRRASLQRGGNGAQVQRVAGAVEPELVDQFQVDEQGAVSFDATSAPALENTELWHSVAAPGKKRTIVQARYAVEWDVVPDWSDLLDFVRYVRSAKVEADISLDRFLHEAKVVIHEAKEQLARDDDERRQANRATLARWIQEHGSQNQRERLGAGLLPWSEAHSELERHLFAPLEQFAPYARFVVSDICVCQKFGEPECGLKFQSVDATELDAEEWDRFTQIRAAVPEAQFQMREHRATCRNKSVTAVKRGVIVKRYVDLLTFKREYALGGVHDVE